MAKRRENPFLPETEKDPRDSFPAANVLYGQPEQTKWTALPQSRKNKKGKLPKNSPSQSP